MRSSAIYSVTILVAMMAGACQYDGATNGETVSDESASITQQALISPDQDLSDFPPWIWPYIHPVDVFSHILNGKELKFDFAAKLLEQSAHNLCGCSTTGKYSFGELLELVDISFDMQYNAIRLAKLQAKAQGGSASGMVSNDDPPKCGNGPWPWPIPWPWLKLIHFEGDLFITEMNRWYKLDEKQQSILKEQISKQMLRFETLEK
jgi:hypothetical protein